MIDYKKKMEIKVIDNIKLIKPLGKGSYGEVFLTEIVGLEGLYATKKLNRSYFEKEENFKNLYNEITILKQIKHPNIINHIEDRRTSKHIYIVMEYCNGGSLSECLKQYKGKFKLPFNEKIVQYLMKQILNGLNEFHSKNILHRDLKLNNILVNFPSEHDKISLNMLNATVKIIDFGLSSILKDDTDLANSTVGSPIYMAPEILDAFIYKKNIEYRNKADIWSLGILCYKMLVDEYPFNGKNRKDLNENLKKGIYIIPNNLSHETILFINSMIQKNPDKRLNCKELLKHDFLNKDISQLQKVKPENIPGVIGQWKNNLKISILDN